jgi:uncharacterized protein YjdB
MAVKGAVEGSVIHYYSSDESVAVVDDSGNVTIVGKGTATVVAVVDAIGEYQQTSAYYVLTVKGTSIFPDLPDIPDKPDFPDIPVIPPYSLDQEIKIDLSDRKAFCGEILDPREVSANGDVTYSVSDPSIAEVDAVTGKITVHEAGEVIITVNASAIGLYKSASVSYKLTVEHHFVEYMCACGLLDEPTITETEPVTETETETETESKTETESVTETETETESEIETSCTTETETEPKTETETEKITESTITSESEEMIETEKETDKETETDVTSGEETSVNGWVWIVVAVAVIALGGAATAIILVRKKKS